MSLVLDGVRYRLDQQTYPEGLLVLEVPIDSPPRAWFAQDKAHYCRVVQMRWAGHDLSDFDEFKGLGPFHYWARVNAQPLRHQEFYTLAEVADAIALEVYAWQKLRDLLLSHGLLLAGPNGSSNSQ